MLRDQVLCGECRHWERSEDFGECGLTKSRAAGVPLIWDAKAFAIPKDTFGQRAVLVTNHDFGCVQGERLVHDENDEEEEPQGDYVDKDGAIVFRSRVGDPPLNTSSFLHWP